jgi:hypothetical protein
MDTWGTREMPVLSTAIALLENSYMVTVSDIAQRTGLDLSEVARSLEAMDPTYVDFRKTETGGDPRFWYVRKVTPAARQAVGQWPTAESLIDRLAAALGDAADQQADFAAKESLSQAAGLLAGTIRDAAIQAAAVILGQAEGSGPRMPG